MTGAERARWLRAVWLHDALRDADEAALARWAPDTPGSRSLRHGPASAARAEAEGETDRGVLDAVRYHSVGFAGWDMVGRVLYCADYLEPGREFDREWRAALAARFPEDSPRGAVRGRGAARHPRGADSVAADRADGELLEQSRRVVRAALVASGAFALLGVLALLLQPRREQRARPRVSHSGARKTHPGGSAERHAAPGFRADGDSRPPGARTRRRLLRDRTRGGFHAHLRSAGRSGAGKGRGGSARRRAGGAPAGHAPPSGCERPAGKRLATEAAAASLTRPSLRSATPPRSRCPSRSSPSAPTFSSAPAASSAR